MKLRERIFIPVLMLGVVISATEINAQVFSSSDPVLAIDLDGDSSFPPGETPFNAVNQDPTLKYLNFGGFNGALGTGILVTPNFGASVVQSLNMTTANDFPERDPSVFSLYGTNDAVMLEQNGFCDPADFTPIIVGSPIDLPGDQMVGNEDGRFMQGTPVDFANAQSYTSYLIIIEDTKNESPLTIMQVGAIQLYTGAGGTGDQILAAGDGAIACFSTPENGSDFPNAEIPTNTIDGTAELKYLNFGIENSGFIIRRADGAPVVIDGFTITTANDEPARDPSSYTIEGTNDPVTSEQNSDGSNENWVAVASGTVALPDDRFTESDFVPVANTTAYNAYRVVFPTVKATDDPLLLANSMQIGEMTFTGEVGKGVLIGDVNCDGEVNLLDVAPFVDILTGDAPFNAKADIDQSGSVDLLDVNPFVLLLTGG